MILLSCPCRLSRRSARLSVASDLHWPLATWVSLLPAASTIPHPIHRSPGSIPMTRICATALFYCCQCNSTKQEHLKRETWPTPHFPRTCVGHRQRGPAMHSLQRGNAGTFVVCGGMQLILTSVR